MSLADELVIFSVRADPKPRDTVLHVNAKSPTMKPNAHRGKLTDSLELKRRMTWVGSKQRERLVREGPDLDR